MSEPLIDRPPRRPNRQQPLVGLPGLHVTRVVEDGPGLVVTVESPAAEAGCRACGVIAVSHGRRTVDLVDAPCFGRPVRVMWRKRTWRCRERVCVVKSFTEQDERVCHRRFWPTKAEARLAVGTWIEDRYNRRRRHSAIGMISPVRCEQLHTQAAQAA